MDPPLLTLCEKLPSTHDDQTAQQDFSCQNAENLQAEGLGKVVEAKQTGHAIWANQEQSIADQAEEAGEQVEKLGAKKVCAEGFGVDGEGDHRKQECCVCHQPCQRGDRILQGAAHC